MMKKLALVLASLWIAFAGGDGGPRASDSSSTRPAEIGHREPIEGPQGPFGALGVSSQEKVQAQVRGRFRLPDGRPAAGVRLELVGWQANQARVFEFGEPENWENPRGVLTDAEGRFHMELDPPQAFQFTLNGKFDGYGEQNWRWSKITPGQVLDLGDVLLAPSVDVLVRIIDVEGKQLVGGGWGVYGAALASKKGSGSRAARVRSFDPESDGRFRLVGLPAGPVSVQAYSPVANWVDGPKVRLVLGQTAEVEILYAGPPTSSRITLVAFVRPFHTLARDLGAMRLTRDGVVIGEGQFIGRSSNIYRFDNLESGVYTVEIKDRRFEPWSQGGVLPGERVRARLRGNAGVVLEVYDAQTGERIEHYSLTIQLEQGTVRPNKFGIKTRSAPVPGGNLFDGLVPVPQTLLISTAEHAELALPLHDLMPNERRVLQVPLVRGVKVQGQFTNGLDCQPIANARVLLMPVGSEARHVPMPINVSSGGSSGPVTIRIETSSDENGRFEFPVVAPGEYALVGVPNPWTAVVLDPVIVKAQGTTKLDLLAPLAAGLRGQVLCLEGASYSELSLRVKPTAPTLPGSFALNRIDLPLTKDGQFVATNLPAGGARLSLVVKSSDPPVWGDSSSGLRMDVGYVTLVAGQTLAQNLILTSPWPGDQ